MRQDADREEVVPQVRSSLRGATLLSEVKMSIDLSEVVEYLGEMSPQESEHFWSELDRLGRHEFAV